MKINSREVAVVDVVPEEEVEEETDKEAIEAQSNQTDKELRHSKTTTTMTSQLCDLAACLNTNKP